jgi:hypothetical protein
MNATLFSVSLTFSYSQTSCFFPSVFMYSYIADGNAIAAKINSNWETVFLEYSSNSSVQYMEFDAVNFTGGKKYKEPDGNHVEFVNLIGISAR